MNFQGNRQSKRSYSLKGAIHFLATCYPLGNLGFINLQLILPVPRLESVEHYRGFRVQSVAFFGRENIIVFHFREYA